MAEFRMPSLGADMDAGVLVEWLVKPGDKVSRGDIVAVVETQKGAIDVEIFDDGFVQEIVVPVGVEVPVDTILAILGDTPPAAGASTVPAKAATPASSEAKAVGSSQPAQRDTHEAAPAPSTAESSQTSTAEASAGPAPEPPPHEVEAPAPEATAAAPAPPPAAAPTSPKEQVMASDASAAPTEQGAPGDAPTAPKERVAPPTAAPAPLSRSDGLPLASPRARRLAADRGIDLATIRGTGPHGSITGDDVERAPAAATTPTTATTPKPRRRRMSEKGAAAMREAIAAAMARSKREIPHYYLSHTVDLTAALDWLKATNRARPVSERLLPAVLPLRAIARALADFPELNGTYEDGRYRPSAPVHLGFAIALRGGGLIAPAIKDAAGLDLTALMVRVRDLVARARSGGLRSSELQMPTITVTSLGDRGVDAVTGVIYPPQVAIVGVGTPVLRPWVVDGELTIRTLAVLTLAADHRVSDGHRGALFLAAVDRLLQEPEAL
ncbi:MAG: 2-oxo acid dehydrogenase subunit E2 [Myxococcales bacterium]|nr:2-oxo acid dehydrogenase subunit E2 [Myxococcales bacterium]